MIPFDIDKAPLQGVSLIEAGAGTGKTHAITGIFLRLIVEQALPIEQILVVTYTKAATEELKGRIRSRLRAERQALEKELAAELPRDPRNGDKIDPAVACRRIQDALIAFDRASIFTIHGFCQRLLSVHAFETGHLFDAELIQDIEPLLQESADDFWRRYLTSAPRELVYYALQHLKNPEALADLQRKVPVGPVRIVPARSKPTLRAIRLWRRSAAAVKAACADTLDQIAQALSSSALSGKVYGKKVEGLIKELEQWDGGYPLFAGFECFTTGKLVRSTRKNQIFADADHPFFQLCETAWDHYALLEKQLSDYLRYLKLRFVEDGRRRLQAKKSLHNQLGFDDLLTQTHRALYAAGGEALTRAVQTHYRAALVDEFQDTDPLQYAIFARLFSGSDQLLFMIGDPKQAIYSFRGADLYSYLLARRNAQYKYTLTRNWRATPDLVQAVNTIFDAHPRPFGFESIDFEPAVCAAERTQAAQEALRLWYLTPDPAGKNDKPISKGEAVPLVVDAVAQEIVTLLNDPAGTWQPGKIAVLVRTNKQARRIKAALALRRVPAVLYSAGRVFETREAQELLLVIQAVADPSDLRRVRAALATRLLGAGADELLDSVENPAGRWSARWNAFSRYNRIWLKHGFFRMFNRLLGDEKIKPRLLTAPDGERRVTDLLHTAELTHQAASSRSLGVEGVVKWLATQCAASRGEDDAQKLRLESDAHAVRIITIHKSKGLQFDVVFCPFTWTSARRKMETAFFHDAHNADQATFAVGPELEPGWQEQALMEELAENLRLFYVSLTRACSRCYLVWGRINETELSAPAYLLHGGGLPPMQSTAALKTKMKALTDAGLLADLMQLAARSAGTIVVEPLPRPALQQLETRQSAEPELHARTFERELDFSWRVASYSALVANVEPEAAEQPDYDQRTPAVVELAPDYSDLGRFPAGAHAGLFFHELLEKIDLADAQKKDWRCVVDSLLAAHSYDARWAPAIEALLQGLAAAPLETGREEVRLGAVPPGDLVKEMAFYFPLKRFTALELQALFARHGRCLDLPGLELRLARLTFAPLHGYLKGFIDLVLRSNNRYYLLDWKSNRLGAEAQDYAPQRLAAEMAEAYYFLQYTLYVVALDQLLRTRLPDYSYATHFGGVFYLFLRGIGGKDNNSGVYYSLPDEELVLDLRNLLLDI